MSIDTGLKGDCTVAISDSDFMDMVSGKIGPQKVRGIQCCLVTRVSEHACFRYDKLPLNSMDHWLALLLDTIVLDVFF